MLCFESNTHTHQSAPDTWTCHFKRDYPAMADDSAVNTTMTSDSSLVNDTSDKDAEVARATAPTSPLLSNGKSSPDLRSERSTIGRSQLMDSNMNINSGGRARQLSGLELKIQELRAEKEAVVMENSNPSSERMTDFKPSTPIINTQNGRAVEVKDEDEEHDNNQDTPLDFSVKRRASSFSGSSTDDSRASSSSPSHGTADYRGGTCLLASSPSPEGIVGGDVKDFGDITGKLHHRQREAILSDRFDNHHIHHLHPSFNKYNGHRTPSPDTNNFKVKSEHSSETGNESSPFIKQEHGEEEANKTNGNTIHANQTSPPRMSPNSTSSLPNPLLNGLGGLFPGLNSNFLSGKSAMGAFSQMAAAAAFMDPRAALNIGNGGNINGNPTNNNNNNNKKATRPFKAYPKEALQMPLGGFFGTPGLSPAILQQGLESGMFGNMNTEDLMALYNQQLKIFSDKQVTSSTPQVPPAGRKGRFSPPSPPSSAQPNNNHIPHHSPQAYRNHTVSPRLTANGSTGEPNGNSEHQQYMAMSPTSSSILTPRHQDNNGRSPNSEYTAQYINNINNHHHAHNNSSTGLSNGPPGTTLVSSTSPSPSSSSNQNHHSSNSRKRPRSLPDEQKDAAYWERRRKNNDAAKRSRDARRAKEDEIALRAALLEQENIKLRVEVASLKTETSRLRCLLYNS